VRENNDSIEARNKRKKLHQEVVVVPEKKQRREEPKEKKREDSKELREYEEKVLQLKQSLRVGEVVKAPKANPRKRRKSPVLQNEPLPFGTIKLKKAKDVLKVPIYRELDCFQFQGEKIEECFCNMEEEEEEEEWDDDKQTTEEEMEFARKKAEKAIEIMVQKINSQVS